MDVTVHQNSFDLKNFASLFGKKLRLQSYRECRIQVKAGNVPLLVKGVRGLSTLCIVVAIASDVVALHHNFCDNNRDATRGGTCPCNLPTNDTALVTIR